MTNTPSTPELLPVIQADIERAEAWCREWRNSEGEITALYEAFARHRIASEQATVERAVAALHPAWFQTDYNHKQAQLAIRSILTSQDTDK